MERLKQWGKPGENPALCRNGDATFEWIGPDARSTIRDMVTYEH